MPDGLQHIPHYATKRRMMLVLGLALALALLTGWAIWRFGGRSEDPRITEIRTLQRELAAKYPPEQAISGPVDAVARVAAIGQVMAKVQQLPPELRPQAMRVGQDTFRKIMEGKVSTYFSLPAEKRQDFLDQEIRQMEFMRKAFEAGQTVAAFFGGGKSAGGKRGEGVGPRPPFGPPGGSEGDRNRFRKQIIDSTTPEQRARFVEYIGAIERRRGQLGLPAMPPPP
ncbi:MAG: hypothetical protein HQ464_07275 [Planctomycetes bacterium]|nr:hypothetical protein [Planctomycetota bacterium]